MSQGIRTEESMSMNATPPDPVREGSLVLRALNNPLLVATIVAFGPSLLLLYTAAVEWPRQTDRYYGMMQEHRDALKENQALLREQQRALNALQQQTVLQHAQTIQAMQGLQKVLQEIWWWMQAERKKEKETADLQQQGEKS